MIRGGRAQRLLSDALQAMAAAGARIADIGTPQRFHKELRPFEAVLARCDYRAYGFAPEMRFGRYNCDGHADIEALPFADAEFDGVICLDVIEHVGDPFRAARELMRVVRPGGHLLVTIPFLGGYHGKDGSSAGHHGYPDHWRFTHTGFLRLFDGVREATLHAVDGPIEFRLRQFYLQPFVDLPGVRAIVDALDRPRLGGATSRHLMFAVR